MRLAQTTIEISTRGRGFYSVTAEVEAALADSGLASGLCHLFLQHTSASLVIQENADPTVLSDLETWLAVLAPEGPDWEHDDEGPDDMPAHAKSAITRTQETVPFAERRLALGTWQGIFLAEHRRRPHVRRIFVTFVGVDHA